jgi:hypothetical protein
MLVDPSLAETHDRDFAVARQLVRQREPVGDGTTVGGGANGYGSGTVSDTPMTNRAPVGCRAPHAPTTNPARVGCALT